MRRFFVIVACFLAIAINSCQKSQTQSKVDGQANTAPMSNPTPPPPNPPSDDNSGGGSVVDTAAVIPPPH